jgi:hypothetical protein
MLWNTGHNYRDKIPEKVRGSSLKWRIGLRREKVASTLTRRSLSTTAVWEVVHIVVDERSKMEKSLCVHHCVFITQSNK